MPGFSTLGTAISGLNAAQRAIDTTAQNIANANTVGYSRQQVQLSSIGASTAANFHTGGLMQVVAGVQIDGIVRVRDIFLETARVEAGAAKQTLDARVSTLGGVEQLFNEPGDNGLQAAFDDFYASWHGLAQNPGGEPFGGQVLQKANSVATQLKFVATGIEERWVSADSELKTTIGLVNQATSDLAQVNQKIREGTVSGRPVNELLDRRDTLVRTIGDLAGGRAVETDDRTVDVIINGISVVHGNLAQTLTVTGAGRLADAVTDPPRVMLGDLQVPVSSGKAAGLLAALGSDLPIVADQLNQVAVAMRDAFNIVHAQGFTLAGEAGSDFFSGTGALDLAVIPTTSAELAVSSAEGVVDGGNALALADLGLDDKAQAVLGGPGASELIRGLAADLGTKLQGLTRAADVQDTVLTAADAAANSDSGVSIDEEMTSLLMYQRAYQASARVISAVDEMLDTLINRTGTR
jgi:flagellar hook-associated protein 1 FlgK